MTINLRLPSPAACCFLAVLGPLISISLRRIAIAVIGIVIGLPVASVGGVPIPDLVIYGKVYERQGGSQVVNPDRIEISASLNADPAIVAKVFDLASSADPSLREYFVLRVPRQDGTRRTSPGHSIAGDVIHIYVDGVEVKETASSGVAVSGAPSDVRRLDLNGTDSPDADSDADGLPDDWERTYFENLDSQTGAGDANEDGVSNFAAYAMGVDPRIWVGDKLPTLEKEGANFVFYFRRNRSASHLNYVVQQTPTPSLPALWQQVIGTLSFVRAEGDSDLYKMTIPRDAEARERYFRLLTRQQ